MINFTISLTLQSTSVASWLYLFAAFKGKFHKTKEEITVELNQIRKAQQDPNEFAPIYNKYYNEIFIYISKRVGDYDLVGDITSKTFTNCLINLHKFKYMGVPFSAWLYKIAMNEVRLFFRAKKNHTRTISLSEQEFGEFASETVDESNYELAQELIPKLLSQLNENELQCIELRFFEKKSFKEIGFIMGLSPVNAKVRTYRILKKLRELSQEKEI